ncbi:hypothetical protein BU23DRAFT_550854 [Bimuria novae-zelandiae CBS 107.79]|uniref:Uncharacterized protein n=1 Tax=Bimuria novae-zelandiae CBS 107.79 TaxID=1447943 RepID=A0A6A5VWI2_9PLEO|nr:hypothetical protein BU23DRAFT_550854 [Bimuria novae-zelandiae CBS 107.79]
MNAPVPPIPSAQCETRASSSSYVWYTTNTAPASGSASGGLQYCSSVPGQTAVSPPTRPPDLPPGTFTVIPTPGSTPGGVLTPDIPPGQTSLSHTGILPTGSACPSQSRGASRSGGATQTGGASHSGGPSRSGGASHSGVASHSVNP